MVSVKYKCSENVKSCRLCSFRRNVTFRRYETPMHLGSDEEERFDDLERKYWRNVTLHQPFYGADIEGSVTDPDQQIWNFQKLPSILDIVSSKQVSNLMRDFLSLPLYNCRVTVMRLILS